MKGVPASFTVEDELYYLNAEADKIPQGTAPIEVLAETSPSVQFKTAAPRGVDHQPPDSPHRRHHARPRRARARPRRVQDAARQRGEVGQRLEAVSPSTRVKVRLRSP